MTDPAPVATWLGRMAFASALDLQLRARDALLRGDGPPTIFVVEHPPTITIGRRGAQADVLWSPEQLARAGVAVCEAPRGGQLTLHAPGQVVAYPVVRIGTEVRAHVTRLGEVAAALLREAGVHEAAFELSHPGVWVRGRKLASIGVHVSRGVAVQGIAINLDVDLRLFGALVSCGMAASPMTNAVAEGARAEPVEVVARRYAEAFAARPLAWVSTQDPAPSPATRT